MQTPSTCQRIYGTNNTNVTTNSNNSRISRTPGATQTMRQTKNLTNNTIVVASLPTTPRAVVRTAVVTPRAMMPS